MLKQLNNHKSKVVVLTNMEGSRGVDFKFDNGKTPAHVVIAWTPTINEYATLLQAHNRGSRNSYVPSESSLICDKRDWSSRFPIHLEAALGIMKSYYEHGNDNIKLKVKFA